jgi:hypothetical protein
MVHVDHFGPRDLTIAPGRYENGRLAVQLLEDGEYYATLSVNIPEAAIGPDQFLAKDYGENTGLIEQCIAAGVVAPTGQVIELPIGSCPVYRLAGA